MEHKVIYQTISASGFRSTLGVDTHIGYTDGSYANVPVLIADLANLGITNIRDGITNGQNGSAPLSSYITLAKAGIKFTFILEAASPRDLAAQLTLVDQVVQAVPGSVQAIEGPNEINNQPVTYNGVSGLQGAVDEQKAIYAAVHADPSLGGVAVDYFTGYDAGGIAAGPDPSTVPGLADNDTAHPYPNFAQAPAYWVARATALVNEPSPTGPAVYTETGYSTNQVNADVQAKYTLDLLFDTAEQGISKTYLYELLDAYKPGSPQGDAGWGLFDDTGAPKEVASALHNLTSLLADSGAGAAQYQPTAVAYTLVGLPSTGNTLAIQKSDGTNAIAVWNEPQLWSSAQTEITVQPVNIQMNLGATYAQVQVFDPLFGTQPTATYTNVNSIQLSITDHPIIVETSSMSSALSSNKTDTLVLNLSEDAFQGDAQFTVSVDGVSVGSPATVTTLHSTGNSQAFTFNGNFGTGAHTVAVNFLNDAFQYSSTGVLLGDRNLYVASIALDGVTTTENAAQYNGGNATYSVLSGTATSKAAVPIAAPAPVVAAAPTTDTLVLNLSEDAFQGDAQFTVSVDGVLVGGPATVTTLHSTGNSQAFTFNGSFGAGPHSVAVNFLNDAHQYSSAGVLVGDRNLYVTSIALDGVTTAENAAQYSGGSVGYTIPAATTAATTTTPAPTQTPTPVVTAAPTTDTLVLNLSEDAFQGDAQFTVSVDGVSVGSPATVTTLHSTGKSQAFTFNGNFGTGAHTVAVNFLNDAFQYSSAGALVGDRNLYVTSIALDGVTTTENAAQYSGGSVGYAIPAATAATTTPTPAPAPAPAPVVATAPVVAATPTAAADIVSANVSNGSNDILATVNVSAASTTAALVPTSPAGTIGAAPLVTFNWNPASQLANFIAAQSAEVTGKAGTPARIIGLGDSTTRGFGSAQNGWGALSYVNELAHTLNADGVAAQSNNFLSSGISLSNGMVEDNRVSLVGGATTPFVIVPGGTAIETTAAGQGVDFTLDQPSTFNRVDVSYIDIGSGSASVAVDGGPVLGTLQFGNTGQTLTQTLNIPLGTHATLNIRATSGNPVYVQGASVWNAAAPAVSVYNGGIGGWDSGNADTSVYNNVTIKGSDNGFGQTAGAAALHPNLAIIDFGINDIIHALDTPDQTVANITQITASLRAAGSDVIVMIPQPFNDPAYATQLPLLRTALQNFSLANNVPLVDLSATYGNSFAALSSAGLMGDSVHPDATLYADIGSGLAQLISGALGSAGSPAASVPTPVAYSAGNGAVELSDTSTSPTTLQLGTGESPANLVVSADPAGNLILTDGTRGDTIKIDGLINHPSGGFQQLTFIGGTTWTRAQLSAAATTGTAGPDNITRTPGNDVIDGRGGGDVVFGNGGNDTYIFHAGYGGLQINNETAAGSAAAGTLDLGSGLNESNLWLSQVQNNLSISVLGSADTITVKDWFSANPSAKLAQIVAGDGLKLDTGVTQLLSAMTAYATSHPGFNPATVSVMPTDLTNAISSAWHT